MGRKDVFLSVRPIVPPLARSAMFMEKTGLEISLGGVGNRTVPFISWRRV
jgi:hypothetical protein